MLLNRGATGAHDITMLTPQETAKALKVSVSWLAKARMRGDGPPFIRLGRAIRYSQTAVLRWIEVQIRKVGAAPKSQATEIRNQRRSICGQ